MKVPEFLILLLLIAPCSIAAQEDNLLFQNLPVLYETQKTNLPPLYKPSSENELSNTYATKPLIFRDSATQNGASIALFKLGKTYQANGQLKEAIVTFQQALQYALAEDQRDNELIYLLFKEITNRFYDLGQYDSSIHYCYIALNEIKSYTYQKISFQRNLAIIWIALGETDKALQYLDYALEIAATTSADDAKTGREIVDVYDAMCVAYMNKKEYNKVLHYAQKVIDHPYAQKMRICDANLWMGDAYLFMEQENPRKAIGHFEKALGCYAPGSKPAIATLIHFGIAYAKLENYKKSEHYLQAALKSARAINEKRDILQCLKNLAYLYNKMGYGDNAYQYMVSYTGLKDSLVKEDQKLKVLQTEAKYHLSQRDKELAEKRVQLLNKEAQIKNKNLWITAIITTIVLLSVFFAIVMYNIRRRQKLHNEVLQLQAIMKGEEKERTRLAHELHDGIVVQFSAVKMNLSTLPNKHKSLEESEDYEYILQSLDQATKELRKTAHHLMPDMLLEDGLKEAAFYFCKTLMASHSLNINFQHFGDLPRLNAEFELSVYRIIQELVQNIIKHANATEALVQISYFENSLNITIEDNGQGFDTGLLHNGMGLRSIRARVKALKGEIDIKSTIDTGTVIYMEFDTSITL